MTEDGDPRLIQALTLVEEALVEMKNVSALERIETTITDVRFDLYRGHFEAPLEIFRETDERNDPVLFGRLQDEVTLNQKIIFGNWAQSAEEDDRAPFWQMLLEKRYLTAWNASQAYLDCQNTQFVVIFFRGNEASRQILLQAIKTDAEIRAALRDIRCIEDKDIFQWAVDCRLPQVIRALASIDLGFAKLRQPQFRTYFPPNDGHVRNPAVYKVLCDISRSGLTYPAAPVLPPSLASLASPPQKEDDAQEKNGHQEESAP